MQAVADLGGTPGPKFSQFHAVYCKIWQNRMLTLPRVGAPPTGTLDPPLHTIVNSEITINLTTPVSHLKGSVSHQLSLFFVTTRSITFSEGSGIP